MRCGPRPRGRLSTATPHGALTHGELTWVGSRLTAAETVVPAHAGIQSGDGHRPRRLGPAREVPGHVLEVGRSSPCGTLGPRVRGNDGGWGRARSGALPQIHTSVSQGAGASRAASRARAAPVRPRPRGRSASSRTLLLCAALAVAGCSGAVPAAGPFQDARAIAATPRRPPVGRRRGRSRRRRPRGAGSKTHAWVARAPARGAFLDPVDVDPTNGLAIFVADRAAGTVPAVHVRVPARPRGRRARRGPRRGRRGSRPASSATATAPNRSPSPAAPDGGLFVLDGGRRHVLQLSSEGDVQRVLGAGQLVDPVDLALEDGTLWVADRARGVVQRFDAFGSSTGAVEVAELGPLVSVDASRARGGRGRRSRRRRSPRRHTRGRGTVSERCARAPSRSEAGSWF